MGGRGASSSGGAMTGGASASQILGTESLVSARERYPNEVDNVLDVAKDISEKYGVAVEDLQIAYMDKSGQSTMAYYDNKGNLAINEKYFDSKKMNQAYDECVKNGFHPPRGNMTGIEATTAHEMGHRLTDVAGEKMGNGSWKNNVFALDKTANTIVSEAQKNLGYKSVDALRSKISGYAKQSNAEAISEAFADVYCNGKKASKESKAVVSVLEKYLGR